MGEGRGEVGEVRWESRLERERSNRKLDWQITVTRLTRMERVQTPQVTVTLPGAVGRAAVMVPTPITRLLQNIKWCTHQLSLSLGSSPCGTYKCCNSVQISIYLRGGPVIYPLVKFYLICMEILLCKGHAHFPIRFTAVIWATVNGECSHELIFNEL